MKIGILTSGGDCPGINATIRGVCKAAINHYGMEVVGIHGGFQGLFEGETEQLTSMSVSGLLNTGGTILGTSREKPFKKKATEEEKKERTRLIIENVKRMGLDAIVCIGGNGTQKSAYKLSKIGLNIVTVPKTIDNDVWGTDQTFGFDTAVTSAVPSVRGAHVEAKNSINGIGLVKVMGRESGFIAAHTSLAQSDVNFCLIPESPFDLDGPNGLLENLKRRILERGHAVILVAEGAGQEFAPPTGETDASGNIKYHDIGIFLKERIKQYFKDEGIPTSVKYIDPSYIIRSAPANSYDSIYCARLGAHAVHAAMAGKTRCLVSRVNNQFVYLPIKQAVSKRSHVDIEGSLWRDVLENTRQPFSMKN